MKFLPIVVPMLLIQISVFAQRPVSWAIQNRKVVLEQFTGIHCATCPSGHRVADSLKAVKPAGSVFLVNIHTGGPALPNTGEPDFRTFEGADIASITGMNITSYPTASINRQRFGSSPNIPLSPAQWSAAIDTEISQLATHNLAMDGYLDVSSRELTVSTQIYCQPPLSFFNSNRYFTVMVLEDSVAGPQLGTNQYPSQINSIGGTYNHNYVLRKILTPPFMSSPGANTFAGGIYYSTISYTVPAQYINNPATLGSLRVLAFMSYGDSAIINAATGPISLTGFAGTKDAALTSDIRIEKEVCEATLKPIVRIYNNGSQPITSATLQSSLNGGVFLPAGSFSGSIAPATSALVAVPPIGFSPNASNDVKFKIVNVNGSPDPNPANDTLTVSNILRTTRTSKGRYQVMRFTQDRWGAETTWKIVEEGSGIVKLASGPYPTLPNNSTALRVDSFRADPGKCYEIIVNDAGGNGINSGSGLGSYRVTSNGLVVYSSNGSFGSRDRALFKTVENLTELPSSVSAVPDFLNSVSLSPNPTAGESNLLFSLARGTKISIQVLDMTGRVVAQIADQNLSAGSHALPISTVGLAGGVYNVRLATAEGVVTRRLVVVK